MDPNATLDSIRELFARADTETFDLADGQTLADLVGALDDWLTKGGFLPDAWERGGASRLTFEIPATSKYAGTQWGVGFEVWENYAHAIMYMVDPTKDPIMGKGVAIVTAESPVLTEMAAAVAWVQDELRSPVAS